MSGRRFNSPPTREPRDAYIGLGSDLGDRPRNLEQGLADLARRGLPPVAISSVWETEGVDTPEPRQFLNLVVRVRTAASPVTLLRTLLAVERALGRTREVRNGPRTLDLDLLRVGELVVDSPGLTLPHPRMWQRRFVLEPLQEIAPQLRHPASGLSIAEVCRELGPRPQVRRQDRATTLLRREGNFYNGPTL